ncbi:MAG TPA: NrfD/PsrC family molybdoenzyme membrane anchor subunit [Thermodesulfobacteriota bacterium]|nr:NrfD/PsrC family molybdoenzyme membrane anchor subunit [Thermodesulfobacteriota bacterium]
MPDTFFTAAPHWQWLVILYLFVGGISGGAGFLAGLLDLVGRPAERPLARLGYYIAFPAIVLGGILLTLDLTRPERFWHMLIQSETGRLMIKWWSPISFGAWAITLFGATTFVAFLGSLAEEGILKAPAFRRLREGALGGLIAILNVVMGLFVAAYTGVLLTVTNRPIWADTTLLGLLFLLSGVSTATAAMVLLALRRRAASTESLHRLSRLDTWIMALELLTLVALVISLGQVARVWLSGWGVLLVVGVVLAGLLVPIALHWRPRQPAIRNAVTAAALVLLGGFLLRVVIVLSSEGV